MSLMQDITARLPQYQSLHPHKANTILVSQIPGYICGPLLGDIHPRSEIALYSVYSDIKEYIEVLVPMYSCRDL